MGYEEPKIREIFERQARESDPEKRTAMLKEASNLLKDGEGHWFTIWWFPQHTPTNVKVKNVHGGPTIHVLNTLEHLWLDPNAKP